MAESKQVRFNYTARDQSGAMKSGSITADSSTGAAKRLQGQGLAPISIKSTDAQGNSKGIAGKSIGRAKKVKSKHIAILARQFSAMIEAGLPLVRSLQAVNDQADHPEFKRVLPILKSDVEAGTAFSVAMARHDRIFPPLMIGMIAAGEVSGSLGKAMQQVSDNYEKEAKLKSKVFAAMIYPIVVLVMAILMVTGMLIFVVPKFAGIFKNLGGALPLPTRILVAMSGFVKIGAPIAFVAAFLFSFWWAKHKNDRSIRLFIDPLKLRLPIMGSFFQKISIARFSSLLASGVPMLQTLEIVSATSGSIVIGDALKEVRNSVRAGKPIASTLSNYPVFPPLVIQMMATGEETGSLPTLLDKVADFYEGEVDTAADALTSVLEPVMIVGLAGIVGAMVISLYLPIFKVFDLVK
jgi:type IV pilus assembly protein PilC